MTAAVVGGTASALGGGKFANGAVTGAYTMLFNHIAHPQKRGLMRLISVVKIKEALWTLLNLMRGGILKNIRNDVKSGVDSGIHFVYDEKIKMVIFGL